MRFSAVSRRFSSSGASGRWRWQAIAANGKITGDGLLASAIAFPAWLLGQVTAWPVRKHVHGERFRILVLALLFTVALVVIMLAGSVWVMYHMNANMMPTPDPAAMRNMP